MSHQAEIDRWTALSVSERMWESLQSRWYPHDPFEPTATVGEHYQRKAEVVWELTPRTVCEFGVRAGYSMYAMLYVLQVEFALGIDCNADRLPWAAEHARAMTAGWNVAYMQLNTADLTSLPMTFDVIHIDADHSYVGCLGDLQLAATYAKTIIVDDYGPGGDPRVRKATDDFVRAHGLAGWELFEPLRGAYIITV